MKVALHVIGSILLSIPILFAVCGLLDVSGLVPGWGFWHGPFIIAWPICLLVAFAILLTAPWFRRAGRRISKLTGFDGPSPQTPLVVASSNYRCKRSRFKIATGSGNGRKPERRVRVTPLTLRCRASIGTCEQRDRRRRVDDWDKSAPCCR
jgi:hypothetical protein